MDEVDGISGERIEMVVCLLTEWILSGILLWIIGVPHENMNGSIFHRARTVLRNEDSEDLEEWEKQYTVVKIDASKLNRSRLLQLGRTSAAVCTVGDTSVYECDIQSLEPGGWITDSIISAYLWMVQQECPNKICCFTDPCWRILSGDQEKYKITQSHRGAGIQNLVQTTDLFAMDILVVAKTLHFNHWACVIVDINKETLFFLESIGRYSSKEFFSEVITFLIDAYALKPEPKLRNPNFKKWKRIVPSNLPKQKACDCGLFLMWYVRSYCMARNRPDPETADWYKMFDFTHRDMNRLRIQAKEEILAGQLRW